MQDLGLEGNLFSGSLDLARLPQSMRGLGLSDNRFAGGITLTALPRMMQYLYLHNNQLSGALDLSHGEGTSLPDNLQELRVHNNKFCGKPRLPALPRGLRLLEIGGNSFDALDEAELPGCVKI